MISFFTFLAVAKSREQNVGIETNDGFFVGHVLAMDALTVTLDHGEGDQRMIAYDAITNVSCGPSIEAHRKVRDHNRRLMLHDLNSQLAAANEPVSDNVVSLSKHTLN